MEAAEAQAGPSPPSTHPARPPFPAAAPGALCRSSTWRNVSQRHCREREAATPSTAHTHHAFPHASQRVKATQCTSARRAWPAAQTEAAGTLRVTRTRVSRNTAPTSGRRTRGSSQPHAAGTARGGQLSLSTDTGRCECPAYGRCVEGGLCPAWAPPVRTSHVENGMSLGQT